MPWQSVGRGSPWDSGTKAGSDIEDLIREAQGSIQATMTSVSHAA
jgi:hypothetical protein